MQRPRKRLKFENILMVIPLLFSACTRKCANTCTETSQRTRKSTRTLFVVKQRKEMVADLEKCCMTTQSIQPLHSQSEETSGAFPLTERTLPSAFLELMTAGKHILRPLRILFVSYNDFSALLASSSVNEAILVRAKNSNGTTVRTFSNFNLLHGRCTLLPFASALTSLCTPVLTNSILHQFRPLKCHQMTFPRVSIQD